MRAQYNLAFMLKFPAKDNKNCLLLHIFDACHQIHVLLGISVVQVCARMVRSDLGAQSGYRKMLVNFPFNRRNICLPEYHHHHFRRGFFRVADFSAFGVVSALSGWSFVGFPATVADFVVVAVRP